MTNITWILLGVLILAFGAFGTFAMPYIRAHITAEQFNILRGIAHTVVFAAEQIFGAKMGKDKLAYALKVAKELLAKKKLTFDEDTIRAAIEEQVKQLNIDMEPKQ